MHRAVLIVSLALLSTGCAAIAKPKLRPFRQADYMLVYPHLVALMKVQGDLPPRAGCPIGFAVLDTPALNAWVTVRAEAPKPPPEPKAIGEIKDQSPPDPASPTEPRCRQFDLTVTSGVLALPRDELRAIVAHELGHVYLGHIESTHNSLTLRYIAEVAVVGIIPTVMIHAGSYPFMTAFSQSEEAAADRFAVDLLIASRSSCGAFAAVLERLEKAQERSLIPRFEWLSSHPAPDRRVETVRELCRARPPRNGPSLPRSGQGRANPADGAPAPP